MKHRLALVALVVRDYDEAIAFYRDRLGFELVEDTPLGEGKRWVVVRPPGSDGCALLLARAVGPEQEAAIGNQSGGRVFLFLHTDDIARDHRRLVGQDVHIVRPPEVQPWGTVLVFADLHGNLWDLIQPATPGPIRS
jgi:catechol 2,3-dioxygenase-like lactoylglutathione lyase family enzyme